jgi:hypothetical protein
MGNLTAILVAVVRPRTVQFIDETWEPVVQARPALGLAGPFKW